MRMPAAAPPRLSFAAALLFLALGSGGGAGCEAKRDEASTNRIQVTKYNLHGTVKEVGPEGRSLTIACDAIPGVFAAETKTFPVQGVRAEVNPGDRVSAWLVVGPNGGWIEQVTRLRGPERLPNAGEVRKLLRVQENRKLSNSVPPSSGTNTNSK